VATRGGISRKRGPEPKRNPLTSENEKLRRQNQRLQEDLRKALVVHQMNAGIMLPTGEIIRGKEYYGRVGIRTFDRLGHGYAALEAASEGKLDSGGWHALMKDLLHLPESMLPAVKWALKQGAWRRANDPIRSVRENAEREAGRMGLSGRAGAAKGE